MGYCLKMRKCPQLKTALLKFQGVKDSVYNNIDIDNQYQEKYWPVSNMNKERVHTYVT